MWKISSEFGGSDPQDFHEFLSAVLEGMNQDLNRVKSTPKILKAVLKNADTKTLKE